MMFADRYKKIYDEVKPPEALVSEILGEAQGRGRKGKRWRAALTAAVLAAVLTSVPVMAAVSPQVYQVISRVSPDIANLFIPIQESCEDQGIRMTVEAVYVDGKEAQVYVSIQDLEGDRVDETLDLFDSYRLSGTGSTMSGCSLVEYDEESGKAVFKITIISEKEFDDRKYVFSVSSLLGDKSQQQVTLDMDRFMENPETEKKFYNGKGRPDMDSAPLAEADEVVLVTDGSADVAIGSFVLKGMGYVNGKLHVQLYCGNILEYDRHAELNLYQEDGIKVHSYSLGYHDGEGKDREDYTEYIFNVPEEELDQYSLQGTFYDASFHMDGDWRVSFRIG